MPSLRRNVVFLILLPACLANLRVSGQTPTQVDETVARQRLVKHDAPNYPPIARAAQVQGNVVLQIRVGLDGHVMEMKVLSGPAMLAGAAKDAVNRWEFNPFLKDDKPVSVETRLTIPFSLGKPDPDDLKVATAFFPLSNNCNSLVSQRANPSEQAKACRAAADEADKFGSNTRFIERRSSYIYCATALMRNNEFKDALVYANKAVAVVQMGHDDESGSSAAYSVRGQAEAQLGDLRAADADLTTAEKLQRQALNTPAGHELNKSYTYALKILLGWHAQVLAGLGRPAEANAAQEEASKL
jgi:TonB family protein